MTPTATTPTLTKTIMTSLSFTAAILSSTILPSIMAFTPTIVPHSLPLKKFSSIASSSYQASIATSSSSTSSSTSRLYFFDKLDKAFEEEGPLGKGITVGKLQIALRVSGSDRSSSSSIFSVLEKNARADASNDDDGAHDDDEYYDEEDGSDPENLSKMCHEVCLALLRKSDDWIAACSESKWFKGEEYGKAESLYNQWADREAAKFEKEYIPEEGNGAKEGLSTVAVVSIILEIQGDDTNFERAGFSLAETKAVLTSIASDCRVEGGDCLNAVEVFWTPSEPSEVLTERDIILDFPELITL